MLFKIEIDTKNIDHLSNSEIIIFFDHEGLEYFIDELKNLLVKEETSHLHFMTPSWGGNELSEVIIGKENTTMNHLRIIINPKY